MNRNSSFPFNNCINKRILHWDEPNFDPNALETLKKLFSGNEFPANVKYFNFQNLLRTPVICTANSNVFLRVEAFKCRIQNFKIISLNLTLNLHIGNTYIHYVFTIYLQNVNY